MKLGPSSAGRTRPFLSALPPLMGALGLAGVLVVPSAVASVPGASAVAESTSTAATTAPADWTAYHYDARGSGDYTPSVKLANAHVAWKSPTLNGQLYGEPLAYGSLVYVATTANVVYALRASNGSVAWSKSVGTPVTSSSLPCGDISPTVGVVGTPAIAPSRHEIFAVADRQVGNLPAHHLVGLDTATGKVLLDEDVDPPGANTQAILQRTGLRVDGGRVVFGYGGNSGDCSTYHGWVVSVPTSGGAADRFEVDAASGASQGAVWMGGAAPVVDHVGDVWVATGNGSTTSGSPDDSDSVIQLSPAMRRVQEFTPSSWASDNASDADLGSTAPVLLDGEHVVQVGKSQTAYVLRHRDLGGIGGQQTQLHPICGSDFDGGSAFAGSTVYLPCRNGTEAVGVAATSGVLTVKWTSSIGSAGPPILAGGSVWVIDGSGELRALNPKTGAVTQQFSLGAVANHFSTPSVGDGLLLAPAANSVIAFAG